MPVEEVGEAGDGARGREWRMEDVRKVEGVRVLRGCWRLKGG